MRDKHFSAFSALEAMNNFRAINRDTGFLLPPRHHVSGKQRFAAAPKSPPASATPMQKMAHRLKTPAGRKLCVLPKQTPEPVFGIIKSVMGNTFDQHRHESTHATGFCPFN